MANHVTSTVSFDNISEEAQNFLRTFEWADETAAIQCFYEIPVEDEILWYTENVGSKWCYFDSIDEDHMSMVSAWSPPIGFYEAIYSKIENMNSPDLHMWVQYEDEATNFIGVWGKIGECEWDECVDSEDYMEILGCTFGEEVEGDWEFNENWNDELNKWYDIEYQNFLKYSVEFFEEN